MLGTSLCDRNSSSIGPLVFLVSHDSLGARWITEVHEGMGTIWQMQCTVPGQLRFFHGLAQLSAPNELSLRWQCTSQDTVSLGFDLWTKNKPTNSPRRFSRTCGYCGLHKHTGIGREQLQHVGVLEQNTSVSTISVTASVSLWMPLWSRKYFGFSGLLDAKIYFLNCWILRKVKNYLLSP